MRKLFLLLLLCTPLFLFAQSLSPERVAKIKSATVRISIEGIAATGSAFFISASGELLTCWHVIEPAFIRDSLGNPLSVRKIFIQYANGQKAEVSVSRAFYQRFYITARANDYCLLSPAKRLDSPFSFFKPGDFSKVPEGQELYACGYPLGMVQSFVSRGILSARYIDSSTYLIDNSSIQKKIYRDAGLLDLSLNKGCSGGPVIKPGATIDDDEVIGIADFMIGPYGQTLEEVNTIADSGTDASVSTAVNIIRLFSAVMTNASNGISSCLSINHFLKDIQTLQK